MTERTKTKTKVHFLSFGAGVQSTALFVMACLKDPRLGAVVDAWPTHAIFADTGAEPAALYDHLERCKAFGKAHGVPVVVVSAGSLADHALTRPNQTHVPAWTGDPASERPGKLYRTCTDRYKIRPIRKWIKAHLGYKPGYSVARHIVHQWIGISLDEVSRMKPSPHPWLRNVYPLVDMRMDRQDCTNYLEAHGWGRVQKSACVFCPYRSPRMWRAIKAAHGDWSKALEVDAALRGRLNPGFVHRSREPLPTAYLGEDQLDLVDLFQNECTGHCGL